MTSRLAPLLIGLALASGCVESEEGVRVDLTVSHHLGDDGVFEGARHDAGDVRGLTNSLGYGVVLERAYLGVSEVELLPCPESSLSAAVRWLLTTPTARAHTAGSSRGLGVPHVLDLMAADGTELLRSTLEPPPGNYCGVRVGLGPADGDAVGMPGDVDMEGASLYLAGSFVAPGAERSVDFELRTELSREGDFEFQRSAQGGGGVELGGDGMPHELRVDLHYGRIFERVAPATQGEAEQAHHLVANLLDDMAVIACEPGADCDQH